MRKLRYSIKYALHGITYLFSTQRNAKIHLFSACIAICLGFWLKISSIEWTIVTLCIALVLGAEAFNTSIEEICDALHPEINPKIKIVKDVSAGAVLIISLGTLIVALIIFLSKLMIKLGIEL